jgi:hypothetical protein
MERKPDRRSGDRHLPRSGDRHKKRRVDWRPDPNIYSEALKAAKDSGTNLTAWLNESMKYLIGLRKDPPPRPAWAEERAARLPDSRQDDS